MQSIHLSLVIAIFTLLGTGCNASAPENKTAITTPNSNTITMPADSLQPTDNKHEIATLAGGCFWCVEAIYQDLKGVSKVESGYAGGSVDNPTYREVCTGTTGHAEVVQVTFDPAVISFHDILHIFFTVHDPTTLNRQGNDVGTQYRSAIFYHSDAQKAVAEKAKKEAGGIWDNTVVTEITPLDKFYPAEKYHQNYFKDNPNQGYCSIVIAPKVKKFREKYQEMLKQ